ncbi:MAG: hypothetical protein A4S12_06580 [Proteobacteria bacterium SG_bin5]|nr:DUF4160 domain-containing protein [Sphingomonas sp.]OQW42652.1 MAG: hypothetical protein A4S12_06580 [Proteobacteria bacterium SG_bin5]
MPTVHREHGLRFIIYTDDHPPPHVHVTGPGIAKIMLEPAIALVNARGLSQADVGRALDVVRENRGMLLEAWKRIHG